MEENNLNQTPVESQAPSQPVQQEVAPAPQASESVAPVEASQATPSAPVQSSQPEIPLEIQKEQEELDAKIAGYGSNVEVKPGVSGQSIDYAKYIGMKVKIASVTIGTKPQYWKDGKKSLTPVGVIPCFIVTAEPLDKLDNGDGTFKDVTVKAAKLNAYFVEDNATGKEVLSFTKDDKGAAWHFCRVLGIQNPMEAVGKLVEIERQLNADPNDDRVWLQMRI